MDILQLALQATELNEIKAKAERKLKNSRMVIYKDNGEIIYRVKDSMRGPTFTNITTKLVDEIEEFKNSDQQCLRI